ncbi:MAG: DUF433 domain-containing protein [Herpetosiphon sp.]|nr:DUF433 domain-containing protein [Herpetosiphon sp.]
MTVTTTIDQHIALIPTVMGGKPHIAGHRISVQQIVVWHERLGLSADEIAATYHLGLADVYAALAYYYDHQQEIDQHMRDDETFINQLRAQNPSKLTQKLHERAH